MFRFRISVSSIIRVYLRCTPTAARWETPQSKSRTCRPRILPHVACAKVREAYATPSPLWFTMGPMIEELWLHKISTQCRCRGFIFWHDVDIWTRSEPDIFTQSLIGSNVLDVAKGKLIVLEVSWSMHSRFATELLGCSNKCMWLASGFPFRAVR